ncbi:MAG: phosphoribosylformylglycinamidine cyclo-ligase [Saprospiraceae bacterium]|nr:MAG: phosphoribosylformylglycinamidine cyclo-ligase [Saprospiraceae bacterium]
MSEHSRYLRRGVSASKDEVHSAIAHLDKGLYPTAFCKILPDIVGGSPEHCNIMHADTAGTKTSLAYIYWRETGDLSVWEGIVQDALVMNLDDMACVGCIQDIVISSTIGRNKHLIPGEVLNTLIGAQSHFVEKMADLGIRLHLAGGETADVGDIVRTVDVGFTTFARMPRARLIVNDIQPGDAIVGLASFGKAAWESEYNGGMGSNGLTSARHDVFAHLYAERYPESFDPALPDDVVYTGSRLLTDTLEVEGQQLTIGKLVLSPTRTYLPLLKAVFDNIDQSQLHGIIHCTGGGQTKVLKFIRNCSVVKDRPFPVPPLFQLIKEESGTSWREMYQVFNMGHRLEIYLPPALAPQVIEMAESLRIAAQVVGRVEEAKGEELLIHTPGGVERYGTPG